MTKDLSDEELIQKAQTDVLFFEELMTRYEGRLKKYVQRISVVSDEDTEEIIQDVFLKCWKNINGFDTSLKFSSWIYRLTHNETISLFRKWKSRGRDQQTFLEDDMYENLPGGFDVESELDQKIQSQIVHSVLEKLPQKQKEILILRFIEDLSYEEIADVLKKPVSSVGVEISRAKKQFAKIMETDQSPSPDII